MAAARLLFKRRVKPFSNVVGFFESFILYNGDLNQSCVKSGWSMPLKLGCPYLNTRMVLLARLFSECRAQNSATQVNKNVEKSQH